MAKIKGMCRNEDCEMCDKIQEAEKSNFKCEKCGKDLIPFGNKTSDPDDKLKKKLIAIIACVVVVLAIIVCIIALGGSGDDKEKATKTEPVTVTSKTDGEEGGKEKATYVEEITPNKTAIALKEGEKEQLSYTATPENSDENIIVKSSDESVATISKTGEVNALKAGKTTITLTADQSGTQAKVEVTVKEKPQPPAGGSKNLGYAIFKGSWPNDVNGRMIFKSSHVIDSKDPKGRVAEAGDYVIGEWADGHLVQGVWYGADNQVKGSVIIGR